ncbi:MAG: hypothetical protein ACI94D_000047 [Neolewinella sp.]|jgi:hypothetical protein
MDRESLKKSGLLEQYILGVTSRKESLLVEKTLEENPEAREDYEKLRNELDSYATNNGLTTPLEGREIRTATDYEDLDHEMILAISERNYSLVIWRYCLMAACLLLLCFSGYLFRLSETNKTEIVTEKAHHAQDNNAHKQALKKIEEQAPDWHHMKTINAPTAAGTVILHFLDEQELVFLDLSHVEPLSEEDAYFIFTGLGDEDGEVIAIVPAHRQLHLHPVTVPEGAKDLRVFRWKLSEGIPEGDRQEDLVAALPLPVRTD